MAEPQQYEETLNEIFKEWDEEQTYVTQTAAKAKERTLEKVNAMLKAASDPHKVNPHLSAYEKFGLSKVPVILFMDIVGYSKLNFDREQKESIELLNRVVGEALATTECPWDDVVCLPTGDGMCLCFISETDIPLKVATQVQFSLEKENQTRKRPKKKIRVRMGIHLGNVLRIKDLKGGFNLAGSAINLAQRAMDCGNEGHILCTYDAYKQLTRMQQEYKQRLKPFPEYFVVKHGLRLKLYNYFDSEDGVGNPRDPRQ